MFAKVVVDVRHINVDVMYTYRIPETLLDHVFVGSRVFVDFNVRKTLGYVVEISEITDYAGNVKEIEEVLDFDNELTLEQVKLATFISSETKSLLISALELMFPSFLKTKFRKYITILQPDKLDADLNLLFAGKNRVLIDEEVIKHFSKIKREVEKGTLDISYDIYAYGKSKRVREFHVHPHLMEETLSLSSKRAKCVEFVKNNPNATMLQITEAVSCKEELVRSLVSKEILVMKERYIVDDPTPSTPYKTSYDYSFDQKEVFDKYHKLDKKPFLLYSNNEEFKLQFYLETAFEVVRSQRQVLIVCPTILSSHVLLSYFEKHTSGIRIHHFSSAVAHADFYQDYMNVKHGKTDLVICTKVGAFLPLERLGLIILVNEEHTNYLAEQHPKLRLKDALWFRSQYYGAKMILSTAAPSMDSFYMQFINKYFLLRFVEKPIMPVRIVDFTTKSNIKDMLISDELKNAIAISLNNKKMAILLLNQKSYSSSLMCQSCSGIIQCPICKIALTYHKDKNIAKCPLCDYKKELLVCEHCLSKSIQPMGYGLERLEELLRELFPIARIHRVDADSFVNRKDYVDTLLAIDEGEVDILLGTTMVNDLVSIGDVGLVATIRADQILYSSDYRSAEWIYQQIANTMCFPNAIQVVQGYHLNHYAIQTAIMMDYDAFFEKEWLYRSSLNYAPVNDTSRLIITGEYKDMYHCANYFKKVFPKVIQGVHEVLGPTYVKRHRGVQLILKYEDFENTSRFIDEVSKKFSEQKVVIEFERYPKVFY